MERKDPLADFQEQAMNGSLRWLASALAILGVGFLVWTYFDHSDWEVFFPIHLKGAAVFWVMGFATVFWLTIAVVNWRNWKRKKNTGPADPLHSRDPR